MVKLIGILILNGVYVKIEDIKGKYKEKGLKKIQNKFVLRYHNYITNIDIHMKGYFMEKDYIILPKHGSYKLLECGILDEIIDKTNITNNININYIGKPTYNQNIIVDYLMKNIYNKSGKKGCIIKALAGCHIKDTEIMMFDGSNKLVQDIKIGDKLMGDDSTSRNVLRLCRGIETMYKITNDKKESYIVNENHILCLKYKNTNIEIVVKDFYKLSENEKRKLKGYKVPIKFKKKDLPIDPYMIGYWLGSIYKHIIQFVNYKILNYFINNLYKYDCYLQYFYRYTYKIDGIRNYNIFLITLKKLNLIKNKHIPDIYKFNSRDNQLKLLAGLIDSNGYLYNDKYIIIHKDIIIINDIIYLCKSIGFACDKKIRKDNITWEIFIYGKGINNIPILCLNKKILSNSKIQIKDVLVSNISIKKLGKNDYYGFKLDNNNKYVMNDFTVTHNSGKSFIGFELIKKLQKKTLIIVPNSYLLDQWKKLLKQLFPENTIGEYYTNKKIDGDIIVTIINSAANSDEFKFKVRRGVYNTIKSNDFFKQFGFIIYDECHMYCTKKFKQIFDKANVENVLGISATPDERIDGFGKLTTFYLGDVIDAEKIEQYKKDLNKFTSTIKMIKYNAPDIYSNTHINPYNDLICVPKIIEEIISDPYRNQLIINNIIDLYNKKLNIFIFSDRRCHLEKLYIQFINIMKKKDQNIINNTFIPEINSKHSSILYGGSDEDNINDAIINSKVIFTTYQYSSTGVSIVKMNALILSTPRRNNLTQIIGRIFRINSDESINRIIIDIIDNKSVLKGQLSSRKKAYSQRDCEYEHNEIDYKDIEIFL